MSLQSTFESTECRRVADVFKETSSRCPLSNDGKSAVTEGGAARGWNDQLGCAWSMVSRQIMPATLGYCETDVAFAEMDVRDRDNKWDKVSW